MRTIDNLQYESDKNKGNDFITDVSSRFYQIDFGNHLRCKLKITDEKIEEELRQIDQALLVLSNR